MTETAPPEDTVAKTVLEEPVEIVMATDQSPLEGATSYPVIAPVALDQLEHEISAATNVDSVQLVLTGPTDGTAPIGTDNQAQLWVLPPALNGDLVKATLKAHVPESDWGIPTVMKAYNAVWEKIEKDPNASISAAEVKALAVGTAIRVNAQQALSSGQA